MVLLIPYAAFIGFVAKRAWVHGHGLRQIERERASANEFAAEILDELQTVQSLAIEKKMERMLVDLLEASHQTALEMEEMAALYFGVSFFFVFLVYAVAIYLVAIWFDLAAGSVIIAFFGTVLSGQGLQGFAE